MSKAKREEPRSYVIRVYRESARLIVGQIEDVQTGLSRSFRSAAELWRVIAATRGGKRN